MENGFPLIPPRHWQTGIMVDGQRYTGTSLHSPATQENCQALQLLQVQGISRVFLDDDFRLAMSPGRIGGCFCDRHRDAFLQRFGYGMVQWTELLESIQKRALTPILRSWLAYTCTELTASFRQQQLSVPEINLGIMVMYMGSEKAGVRLEDYRDVPFRVGESQFNDATFGPIKGKADELFSVLFHRRFTKPELSYSETTAFPANELSVQNLVAKLAIPTICDVRNIMFMSGLTAFPRTYWETLGPALRNVTAIQQQLAGHQPQGPLKHYWGEAGRLVGDDIPYSLFLALGIPFAVTNTLASDGWTFLGDDDARFVATGELDSPGTTFLTRSHLPESLPDLFAWKQTIIPYLTDIPYVVDEVPMVCAWYPTANAVLLWNLSEQHQAICLRYRDTDIPIAIDALGMAIVAI